VGRSVRATYNVSSDEPLNLRVYTPNVLSGVEFVYDTGAQYVYMNYDTAKFLFGPDFYDIHRHNVVALRSVDASLQVSSEEFLFPPCKIQVAHPSTRVRTTMMVNPVITKVGMNLLGIKAISQLPFDVVFDKEYIVRKHKYSTLPSDW
jgi:hypothetical protein